jgi:pimeloyl-ACP methyl ester carboxylesterase
MNVQKKLAIGLIRTKLNGLSIISKRKAGEEAFRVFCSPVRKAVTAPAEEPAFRGNIDKLEFLSGNNLIRGFRYNPTSESKVLLLHGFSSNCRNFDHYVSGLTAKGYQVLAFDAPAHGNSQGKTVNALDYCAMIKKVIELYGPVNAFIAHSFGGLAVCLALESMPHNAATKLVLIAPATETTTAIEKAFEIIGLKNEKIKSALLEVIAQTSGKDAAWFSIRRAMRNIKASVLWIHDNNDDTTPISDVTRVREDNHPNISFYITNGLGHRKIYRDLAVKNTILHFL